PFQHKNTVTSIAFSPDGQAVISNGDQNKVTWSWVSSDKLLQIGCEQLRDHSMLLNPITEAAREARYTCDQYVWAD
ncbi:hypothetical protein, partial [Anabaena sp. PCC 7938]